MNYNFEYFKKNAIIRFLALDKYMYIKNKIYKCDISKDIEFQTAFNSFYKIRRDKKWRDIFFNYFEKIKNDKNVKFEEILEYLYKETGNIEASFSSKMLATINSNMPIWDQYVLKNLNMKVLGKNKQEKLDDTINTYYKIIKIENQKLEQQDIIQAIKEFKQEFKEYELTDIKILDYILWNSR